MYFLFELSVLKILSTAVKKRQISARSSFILNKKKFTIKKNFLYNLNATVIHEKFVLELSFFNGIKMIKKIFKYFFYQSASLI